jgi:hypothetical protein
VLPANKLECLSLTMLEIFAKGKCSSLFVECDTEENFNEVLIKNNVTKLFCLSQVLPANKLGCLRGLIGIKRSSLFVVCVSNEEKHFSKILPKVNITKNFFIMGAAIK